MADWNTVCADARKTPPQAGVVLLGNRLRLAATSDLAAQERSGSREIVAEVPLTGLSFGSRVRRDSKYGDLARFRAVAPEHAIGARGSVLGVGFEDLVLRIERVREGVVLVRVQACVTGILTEQ